jgi:hypothetical protein
MGIRESTAAIRSAIAKQTLSRVSVPIDAPRHREQIDYIARLGPAIMRRPKV